MVFSDVLTGQGIIQDIDFLVNSDANSYTINDKTRNINRALDEVASLILQADGRWEYDDQNETDLPIATTPLINGQQSYGYDSGFLIVNRMEAQDQAGNWRALLPISQSDVIKDGTSLTNFMNVPGVPIYYDKIANSIFLYPAPSYNAAAGLKCYFQRNVTYFTPTDTTKVPGFNPQFHRLLSAKAALDYALANNLSQGLPHGRVPNALTTMIESMEQNLQEYYSRRSKDENLHAGTRAWKFK